MQGTPGFPCTDTGSWHWGTVTPPRPVCLDAFKCGVWGFSPWWGQGSRNSLLLRNLANVLPDIFVFVRVDVGCQPRVSFQREPRMSSWTAFDSLCYLILNTSTFLKGLEQAHIRKTCYTCSFQSHDQDHALISRQISSSIYTK